mgnify:CR=1 FL=1
MRFFEDVKSQLFGGNSHLIGKSKEIKLGQNKTVLLVPFELTGTVGSGIYASLDFIDHNTNTVSFPIIELVK